MSVRDFPFLPIPLEFGGIRCMMITVMVNGHGNQHSNPGIGVIGISPGAYTLGERYKS